MSVVLDGDGEESLGAGIERQVAQFQDLKDTVGEMSSHVSRMQAQYTTLKSQIHALESDRIARQSELSSLSSEIAQLTDDRDALRVEYNDARAQNLWWASHDHLQSSSGSSTMPADERGKLNRKVWLLEEHIKKLGEELERLRSAHAEELEMEYATAAGLRDRIGKLEERTKRMAEETAGAREREEKLKKQVGELDQLRRTEEERWISYNRDLRESLEKERKEVQRLQVHVGELIKERYVARAEKAEVSALSTKSPPRALQNLSPNIGRSPLPLTPTKRIGVKSFTALLQSPTPGSPTVPLATKYAYLEDRHQTLKTEYDKLRERYASDIKHLKEWKAVEKARLEVKKAKKEEKRARKASRSASASASASASTSTGTGTRATQEVQKQARQGEQDEEAVLVEESESLKRRYANSQTDQGLHRQRRTSVTLADDEEEYLAHAEMGEDEPDDNGAEEEELPPPRAFYEVARQLAESSFAGTKVTSRHATPFTPTAPSTSHRAASTTSRPSPPRTSQAATPTYRSLTKPPTAAQLTPDPRANSEKRVVSASKVTPWLGGSPEKSQEQNTSRRIKKTRTKTALLDVDDDFVSPSPPEKLTASATGTVTAVRTPLVRDRGVTADRTSSLRRKALDRTLVTPAPAPAPAMSTDSGSTMALGSQAYETPIRTRSRTETPGSGSQASLNAGATASASTSKRKMTDMEGLTPAQKSAQLKRLGKLSTSEKRELYKDYKGKGRYLAPEQIQSRVTDEYEIDPDLNEGASYAFHDVKRKKVERKNMHGGDCECCKDYYEAVGDIPRFNQPPAWRDESPDTSRQGSVEARDEGVRAHQNKVSRHRETWHKPPTPPGYWSIAFPNTQDVEQQNQKADQMVADKEARLRLEAMQRDSKWRKKQ